ncbi:MAG: hypothetical protein E7259_06840 [Lachnospiraceae bacterium]|nr:hypothetical protein [Lachnospiraceae bacterium]
MKDIRLVDLMEVKALQKIQDEFSKYTGLASLMTDENGIPVTKGSGFSGFCMDLVRTTKLGCSRCEECDKNGAVLTLKNKRATVYNCHAGLTDFAAPIMLEGKMIGSCIGGQIRTEDVDEEKMAQIAKELGIDPDTFIEAAKKTRCMDKEDVERAAIFLEGLAASLSEMAYHNYLALEKSRKMEKAAKAQSEFIMSMYSDLHMDSSQIPVEIREVVDYIRQVDGKIELRETNYKVNDLMDVVYEQAVNMLDTNKIDFRIGVAPSVPEFLLGDAGRIGQITVKALQVISTYKTGGLLTVEFSTRKKSYATMLVITIMDYDSKIPSDTGKKILSYVNSDSFVYEPEDVSLVAIRLLKMFLEQMSASVIMRREEDNTIFVEFSIPQLPL